MIMCDFCALGPAQREANLMDGFWSAQPCYGFLNTFKYAEVA